MGSRATSKAAARSRTSTCGTSATRTSTTSTRARRRQDSNSRRRLRTGSRSTPTVLPSRSWETRGGAREGPSTARFRILTLVSPLVRAATFPVPYRTSPVTRRTSIRSIRRSARCIAIRFRAWSSRAGSRARASATVTRRATRSSCGTSPTTGRWWPSRTRHSRFRKTRAPTPARWKTSTASIATPTTASVISPTYLAPK
mmetsp:Transcript_18030/g.54801  ORF Transcript_18030/g.54801 Transcript_18030/m.54801 type:complete len:200 (+) Transcript_18030:131-730(+)